MHFPAEFSINLFMPLLYAIDCFQSMGALYRVSARYVSRYIFCIFSLYLGTMYLYRKSIDRNASPITYFFYFTLHAFSITVKGKGFNYLSLNSW